MKAVEDIDASDVIVGNFQIFDTTIHALIDPGSTHSYICTDIPSLGNLPMSETEYDILVTNPLGHSVIVNRVYRDFHMSGPYGGALFSRPPHMMLMIICSYWLLGL